MTKERVHRRIILLWEEFALDPRSASMNEMRTFYLWLRLEHRDLLTWLVPAGHDRREDVLEWLLDVRDNAAAESTPTNALEQPRA